MFSFLPLVREASLDPVLETLLCLQHLQLLPLNYFDPLFLSIFVFVFVIVFLFVHLQLFLLNYSNPFFNLFYYHKLYWRFLYVSIS